MWEGRVDEKLIELCRKYIDRFGGAPDGYLEIAYQDLSYDEFVWFIEKSLEENIEFPEALEKYYDNY